MADIANSTVFTNDSVSSGTSDLLQQAFQQVIDEDEPHDNEFVTLLQNDDNCTQTIHLTAAQAAALGLSFEIDTLDEAAKDAVWEKNQAESVPSRQANSEVLKPQVIQQSGIKVLANCGSINNWNMQNLNHQNNTLGTSGKADILSNVSNTVNSQKHLFSNNCLQYGIENNINKFSNIPTSRSLPTVKSTQTILKNIKILPNTSKLSNTVHHIENNTNHSPMILPKATVINTLPSIIRAIPVSTIQLNINPQVSQSRENFPDKKMYNGSLNNALGSSESQVILPQIVMTTQEQRFIAPVVKNTVNLKTARIVNTNVKSDISMAALKPIQIAPRILSTASTISNNSDAVMSKNSNIPIIFRTPPIVKDQDSPKIANYSTTLKCTQVPNPPISLLKPLVKMTNGHFKHSTSQGTLGNSSLGLSNSVTKTSANKQLNVMHLLQNGIPKQKSVTNTQTTICKKNQFSNVLNIGEMSESMDESKPLGSSENPIQIVQQGQTFHSLQHLSQAQLKQIVHVLQQRNQESSDSNEKIVYRVVFPDELDLHIPNPGNLLKNRGAKRGRPKKSLTRNSVIPNKPSMHNDDHDDAKDDRKKVIARTRSGRLSRPPRHMVRDYKHLHHLDFIQPDLDDSDGGYSDYNTNSDKLEDEEFPKDLLTGLEVPKRKISDHFRCPTCNKIYLGRSRMSRHFETHPDHGSPAQLPPPSPEPELKQQQRLSVHDPLIKRKGKKRGPWAYVTPEAKSERRQVKLQEAISVCESSEIVKIAAKPVLNAQPLYKLLVLKSEKNARTFLGELKILLDDVRNNFGTLLSATSKENERQNDDELVELGDKCVCDALGISPGLYKLSGSIFEDEKNAKTAEEPMLKIRKLDGEDGGGGGDSGGKENLEEQTSAELSENSDLGTSDFLHKRKSNCPEVLTALTLMPRNSSPEVGLQNKSNIVSKLLISSPEIQNQISDSSGFQKVDINTSPQKYELIKEEPSFPQDVFAKLSYERQQHVKLDSMEQGFVKLDGSTLELTNSLQEKEIVAKSCCKVPDVLQETAQIITSTCGSNIFGNTENFDVSKLTNYDHITHLDILNISGVIDKNLMMDEKLTEQLNLVDQSHIVDEFVSERLKTIMPDNILENNMMENHAETIIPDTDLDFETLSEEFNRNTKS